MLVHLNVLCFPVSLGNAGLQLADFARLAVVDTDSMVGPDISQV
jgi:hypothetical protein